MNKVSTAVQMKVNLGRTRLPEPVKTRLRKLAGHRLSHKDEISIFAHRHRSQHRNKEDAIARWEEMLNQARMVPKRRIGTKPSRAKRQARLDKKKKHGHTKKLRGKPRLD